jgi:phage head maturation protease
MPDSGVKPATAHLTAAGCQGLALARDAAVRPATLDESARTVEVVWTTGQRVRRGRLFAEPFDEELEVTGDALRLERLNGGAPVLDSHDSFELRNVIGVVEPGSVRIEGGRGTARLRFSERADVDPIYQDIRAGIIRNVSVGYRVHRVTIEEREGDVDLVRVVDWEPMEISMVAVGADPAAQVRAHAGKAGGAFQGSKTMPETNSATAAATAGQETQAERQRVREIRELCRRGGVDQAVQDRLVDDGLTIDQARTQILEAKAEAQAATRISGVHQADAYSAEDPSVRRGLLAEALAHRVNPQLEIRPAAQPFTSMRWEDVAAEAVRMSGGSTMGIGRAQLVERALTTSDMQAIVAELANKVLQPAYMAADSGWRPAAQERGAADLREQNAVRLSEGPELLEVGESGEVKHGGMSDARESFKMGTFARIVSVSRRLILNDDLNAFADLVTPLGVAARQTEDRLLHQAVTSNPVLNETGEQLFSTAHGNLAGTGGAISVATLGAARQALRNMRGLNGEPINVDPAFLIVGPANETAAEQVVAQLDPAKLADVNPFAGRLQVLVEPRIAGNEWYVAARPSVLPWLQYRYLQSARGPQISTRPGFDTMGLEVRVALDYGAGVIDYRGAYKNPGA